MLELSLKSTSLRVEAVREFKPLSLSRNYGDCVQLCPLLDYPENLLLLIMDTCQSNVVRLFDFASADNSSPVFDLQQIAITSHKVFNMGNERLIVTPKEVYRCHLSGRSEIFHHAFKARHLILERLRIDELLFSVTGQIECVVNDGLKILVICDDNTLRLMFVENRINDYLSQKINFQRIKTSRCGRKFLVLSGNTLYKFQLPRGKKLLKCNELLPSQEFTFDLPPQDFYISGLNMLVLIQNEVQLWQRPSYDDPMYALTKRVKLSERVFWESLVVPYGSKGLVIAQGSDAGSSLNCNKYAVIHFNRHIAEQLFEGSLFLSKILSAVASEEAGVLTLFCR